MCTRKECVLQLCSEASDWDKTVEKRVRSFERDHSQSCYLAGPSRRALITGRDDSQRTFSQIQRFAVAFICDHDLAHGECRVQLGQRKSNFVSVRCLDQKYLGQARSAQGVAELNSGER